MKKFILKLIGRTYNLFKNIYWSCRYSEYRNTYNIHDTFRFNGLHIKLYGDGNIITGKHSYIGSLSSIQSSRNCTVKIGKNCRISHNVRMYTENKIADQDFSNENLLVDKGDIIIDDNVWIGLNVVILQGVHIGENSVVGANSVVTRDIPPYAVYGGNPAQLIKYKAIKA